MLDMLQNLIACDLQFWLQYDPDYHQDENDKPTLNETYTCTVCIMGFLADNTESPGAELHSDFLALQGGKVEIDLGLIRL